MDMQTVLKACRELHHCKRKNGFHKRFSQGDLTLREECRCRVSETEIRSFFFFPIYLLIITLNNYSYNTTEKKNTLTIDINRVKQD